MVVVTEDELSESVALKIVEHNGVDTTGVQPIRKGGSGYLRSRLSAFMEVAKRRPVVMLTDLDQVRCAPALIATWIPRNGRPRMFTLRVAVREVESWLLADREGLGKFLHVSPSKISANPEQIPDPKRYLLNLAKKAPRSLRNDLLPARGSIAIQGLGYNACLRRFVNTIWCPGRAAGSSDSLRRAIERVAQLAALANRA